MRTIKLYSTGCPMCGILIEKLDKLGLPYEKITDEGIMINKGFAFVPVLEVDGVIMSFTEANKWIGIEGK